MQLSSLYDLVTCKVKQGKLIKLWRELVGMTNIVVKVLSFFSLPKKQAFKHIPSTSPFLSNFSWLHSQGKGVVAERLFVCL